MLEEVLQVLWKTKFCFVFWIVPPLPFLKNPSQLITFLFTKKFLCVIEESENEW